MTSEFNSELPLRLLDAGLVAGASAAVGGVRLGFRLLGRLPVVGSALRQGVDWMSEDGARILAEKLDPGLRDVRGVVLQMVSSVLDEIDLTALIRGRIDLDLLIESIDMDALVARLDVAAVVDGLDLDTVVEKLVIDEVVSRLDLDEVVDRLNLDAVVSRLDLDAVVSRLDLDAVVARLDIDSIIRRIDLVAVMSGMVERMNLPNAAPAVERVRDRIARGRSPEKRRRSAEQST